MSVTGKVRHKAFVAISDATAALWLALLLVRIGEPAMAKKLRTHLQGLREILREIAEVGSNDL